MLIPFYEKDEWEKLEKLGLKEMKGFLSRSVSSEGQSINDEWFRQFVDNASYLRSADRSLSDEKIRNLPEEYWIERYMPNVLVVERVIARIKDDWEIENLERNQGEISDTVWGIIQQKRNPISSKDWKMIEEYHQTLLRMRMCNPHLNGNMVIQSNNKRQIYETKRG